MKPGPGVDVDRGRAVKPGPGVDVDRGRAVNLGPCADVDRGRIVKPGPGADVDRGRAGPVWLRNKGQSGASAADTSSLAAVWKVDWPLAFPRGQPVH